jgi:DNA-binding NarL/FixJ family response regulator
MLQPELAIPGEVTEKWTTIIADDVEDLRFVVRLALQRSARFEIVGEAADGREAVELAVARRPALVLLDLYMPRMDGMEALQQIRAALPDTRVVVFSGMADVFAEAAVAAGASGVIVKGVPTSELVQRLEEILTGD